MKLKITLTLVFFSAFLLGKAPNTDAPDFTKPDVNGKMITLSQFKGKYVLLDFWGSWCGACRAANSHLKDLYKTYAPKGLEIIGVSVEKVKDIAQAVALWKKAIKDDVVPWLNVINKEAEMKQNVPKMYAITAYQLIFY